MTTTLKFLVFAAAFVTIATVLTPLITSTAGDTTDIELATGSRARLYVMKTPSGYTKTYYALNPSDGGITTQLDFYFFADHDTTKYFDSTENNFSLYMEILNPNTGYSDNTTWDNFNPPHSDVYLAYFYLENLNPLWTDDGDYNVSIEVIDERKAGVGNVHWIFPIVVRARVALEDMGVFDRIVTGFGLLVGDVGGAISGILSGMATAVLGESFVATLGNVLTMNFTGLPIILRTMLAVPIWFGIGYVVFIIIRSLIPTVGGGSAG